VGNSKYDHDLLTGLWRRKALSLAVEGMFPDDCLISWWGIVIMMSMPNFCDGSLAPPWVAASAIHAPWVASLPGLPHQQYMLRLLFYNYFHEGAHDLSSEQ